MLIGPIAQPLNANPVNGVNAVDPTNSSRSANDKQGKSVTSPPAASQELFRFDSPAAASAWMATDDRVMGGVSQSRMRYDPAGHAVFEGVMSLHRNGGFASVRAALSSPAPSPVPSFAQKPAPPPATAKEADYVLTVRGDGKRYKLNLRTAGRFDAVSYQAGFTTKPDAWITVRLPATAFEPTFRGRRVNAPPLDPTLVREAGLMIADNQDGLFALHIKAITLEAR